MYSIFGILIAVLALAILVWGGDGLLALMPGSEKIKSAVRIIAIVGISLYLLGLVASFFGISVPWSSMPTRHR